MRFISQRVKFRSLRAKKSEKSNWQLDIRQRKKREEKGTIIFDTQCFLFLLTLKEHLGDNSYLGKFWVTEKWWQCFFVCFCLISSLKKKWNRWFYFPYTSRSFSFQFFYLDEIPNLWFLISLSICNAPLIMMPLFLYYPQDKEHKCMNAMAQQVTRT